MSDWEGEQHFTEDAEKAAANFTKALGAMTVVPAYVLSEQEMKHFKTAQMALRELEDGFAGYRSDDE